MRRKEEINTLVTRFVFVRIRNENAKKNTHTHAFKISFEMFSVIHLWFKKFFHPVFHSTYMINRKLTF
jgi:hypothetical protein